MKTIKEACLYYMDKYGYDGLCNQHLECGCTRDDLIPCSYPDEFDCVFAKLVKCDEGCNQEDCGMDGEHLEPVNE